MLGKTWIIIAAMFILQHASVAVKFCFKRNVTLKRSFVTCTHVQKECFIKHSLAVISQKFHSVHPLFIHIHIRVKKQTQFYRLDD